MLPDYCQDGYVFERKPYSICRNTSMSAGRCVLLLKSTSGWNCTLGGGVVVRVGLPCCSYAKLGGGGSHTLTHLECCMTDLINLYIFETLEKWKYIQIRIWYLTFSFWAKLNNKNMVLEFIYFVYNITIFPYQQNYVIEVCSNQIKVNFWVIE